MEFSTVGDPDALGLTDSSGDTEEGFPSIYLLFLQERYRKQKIDIPGGKDEDRQACRTN